MGLFTKRRSLILVVVVAIAIRLLFGMAFIANGYNGMLDDSAGYTRLASYIAKGSFGTIKETRTPGYPLFIAMCMKLFGNNFQFGVFLFQNILNIISVVVAFETVRLILKNEEAAFLAGLIAAINIHDVYFNFIFYTDSVTQSASFLSFYFFIRLIIDIKDNKSVTLDLIIASLTMAYGVSCRPAQMYLPFCLAIGAFVIGLVYRQPKKALAMFFVIALSSLIVIFLWSYRNYKLGAGFIYSGVSVHNMYYYNSAVIYAKQNNLPYYKAFNILYHGQDPDLIQYLAIYPYEEAIKHRALDLIMSDIPHYIKCCAKDVLYMFFYPGVMDWPALNSSIAEIVSLFKNNGLTLQIFNCVKNIDYIIPIIVIGMNELILVTFFITSIIGLIKLFRKNWPVASLILGVTLYNIAVSAQPVTIGSYPRFRLTVSLVMVVLSSMCFYQKREIRK